jgi:hypothetical protein
MTVGLALPRFVTETVSIGLPGRDSRPVSTLMLAIVRVALPVMVGEAKVLLIGGLSALSKSPRGMVVELFTGSVRATVKPAMPEIEPPDVWMLMGPRLARAVKWLSAKVAVPLKAAFCKKMAPAWAWPAGWP